jgi:hypothetical protein
MHRALLHAIAATALGVLSIGTKLALTDCIANIKKESLGRGLGLSGRAGDGRAPMLGREIAKVRFLKGGGVSRLLERSENS